MTVPSWTPQSWVNVPPGTTAPNGAPALNAAYYTSLDAELVNLVSAVNTLASQPAGTTVTPVTPEQYGAVGDGTTDDTTALQSAINAAAPLTLTPGKTYRYTARLVITNPNKTITGYGATLYATTPLSAAIYVNVAGTTMRGVRVRVNIGNTARTGDNFNACPFALDAGANNTYLEDCASEYSAGAGLFISGPTNVRTKNCRVRRSLADAFHVTNGATYVTMDHPVAAYPGDDMFAAVSYQADAVQVAHVRWVEPQGYGQANSGRGLSVVGATDVTCIGGLIIDTYQAGIYVAAESGQFNTKSPSAVEIDGMVLKRVNFTGPDQGGIMLFAGYGGSTVTNVNIRNVYGTDARYVKFGNNGQGPTGSASGGTFSGVNVVATFDGIVLNNGLVSDVGTTGVTTAITLGGQWTSNRPPIFKVLTAAFVATGTTQQGAFVNNYIPAGTWEFEIRGAYSCTDTTAAPVFNFGRNQGSFYGASYSLGGSPVWQAASNTTMSPTPPGSATPVPFVITGTAAFPLATGNNVLTLQLGSTTAGAVQLQAGTVMTLRQIG